MPSSRPPEPLALAQPRSDDAAADSGLTVWLKLDSRPRSPTLVRAVLAAVGEAAALHQELLDDLRTAVSEACNNVVEHAYGGQIGPLDVRLRIDAGAVEVEVSDSGGGIRGLRHDDQEPAGFGLAIIATLASRSEFMEREEGGTAVRLAFRRDGAAQGDQRIDGGAPGMLSESPALSGDVVVSLSPPAALGRVLGRVARSLALLEHFSLDQLPDLTAITDALALQAVRAGGHEMSFAITSSTRLLELTLSPFAPGALGSAAAEAALASLAGRVHERRVQPASSESESLYVSVRRDQ